MKKSKKIIIVTVVVIAVVICGVCWYRLYKEPHDQAVASFNKAASIVKEKNDELDQTIKNLKKVI